MTRPSARSTAPSERKPPAAGRALNINAKRLYAWQQAAQLFLSIDPAEAAEVRVLRTANKGGRRSWTF